MAHSYEDSRGKPHRSTFAGGGVWLRAAARAGEPSTGRDCLVADNRADRTLATVRNCSIRGASTASSDPPLLHTPFATAPVHNCDAGVYTPKRKGRTMRRIFLLSAIGMIVSVGVWSPPALAGEAKEKPVIEQILDILLQRGQITPEEYRSLAREGKAGASRWGKGTGCSSAGWDREGQTLSQVGR